MFYDHEHPAILIPEEIVDEVDNDWVVTDMVDEVIAGFTAAQEASQAALAPPTPAEPEKPDKKKK